MSKISKSIFLGLVVIHVPTKFCTSRYRWGCFVDIFYRAILSQTGPVSIYHTVLFQVEVGGKTDWDLGVASHSVNRKGKITVSPAHGYWFLSLRDRNDYAFRTEPSTPLTVNLKPYRIGVYVDCDKGLVSFYNVEARLLIYTFKDSFSDAIHPFFSPCTNKSGRNEAPLIICPVAMTE